MCGTSCGFACSRPLSFIAFILFVMFKVNCSLILLLSDNSAVYVSCCRNTV